MPAPATPRKSASRPPPRKPTPPSASMERVLPRTRPPQWWWRCVPWSASDVLSFSLVVSGFSENLWQKKGCSFEELQLPRHDRALLRADDLAEHAVGHLHEFA